MVKGTKQRTGDVATIKNRSPKKRNRERSTVLWEYGREGNRWKLGGCGRKEEGSEGANRTAHSLANNGEGLVWGERKKEGKVGGKRERSFWRVVGRQESVKI